MTTVDAAAAPHPAVSRPEPAPRAELVADAVARWKEELQALGGRDPLLHFRDLKVGTLDLTAADPEMRKKLLDGEPVPVSRLFPHEPLRTSALRSARAIRDKARELAQERGIDAVMLAIGVATWANPFAAHRPTAPVLLRPATVVARDPAETDFVLEVAAELTVNPVLLHALDMQLGLRFGLDSLRDPAGELRYPVVVERLREFAPAHVIDGFSISHRAILGTFAFEPSAALADLDAVAAELDRHDVVAALAGDRGAARALRDVPTAALASPEHLVLDADTAQADVVAAIANGRSLRVDAPPGSGRTQTIVNAVAELVARGQRVLVVGHKRASLGDLSDRIVSAGLEDVTLDLSSGSVETPGVQTVIETAQRLNAASTAAADPGEHGPDGDQLRRYLDALHIDRDPWDCSAYELMAAIAAAPAEARSTVRVPSDKLPWLGVGTREALRVKMRAYAELGGLAADPEATPWSGAAVPTTKVATQLRSAIDEFRASVLPELRNAATRACVETGLTGPASPAEAFAAVELLTAVAGTLAEFQPEIWAAPVEDFLAATADRRERAGQDRRLSMIARRRTRLQIRDLQVNPTDRWARSAVHKRLVAVHDQLAAWRERARDPRPPRTGPHLPAAVDAMAAARTRLALLAEAHPGLDDLVNLPFADLAHRLAELADTGQALMALPMLAELRSDLDAAGLGELLAELIRRQADPDDAEAAFAYCWQASVLDQVRAADPVLGEFDRAAHERRLNSYRTAGQAELAASASSVLAARVARFAETAAEHEGQATVVLESARTGIGPRSVHELVSAAPDVALAARPCWVLPTLAVARLLPRLRLFDVVIVEDAGLVSPAEAVSAMTRADRMVLVGDEEQLTAPGFVTAVEPISEPDDQQTTYEPFPDHGADHPASVFETLGSVLPRLPLRAEYRMRDDRLAAFAGRSGYGDRLAVVPSASGGRLRHELVTADDEDGVDSSEAEVRRVVEMVFEHARTRPHESLGVITLSRPHAGRIEAALRSALIRAPDIAPFLREDREESFFVKDVDRVCGDVRDAIIMTLGYGRSVDGRVLYRFGALDRPGGHRRLAAAITRARERMTVVSCFGADDLSPRRLTTDGGQALRDFLAYAENPEPMPSSGGGDALALAIAERLRAAGASVVVGYGSGPGRIEVAVRHPLRRDRFVLAVETDGQSYAAMPSTRERDRVRPGLLVRLGWSVYRVWSAAWAADPDSENARLVDAYAKAVADADAYDWASAAAEADVVAGMPDDAPDGAAPESSDDADEGADEPEPDRGTRPTLVRRRTIGQYSRRELAALARWAEYGKPSRPESAVAAELAGELDLLRRGQRADDVLLHAVRVARAGAPEVG